MVDICSSLQTILYLFSLLIYDTFYTPNVRTVLEYGSFTFLIFINFYNISTLLDKEGESVRVFPLESMIPILEVSRTSSNVFLGMRWRNLAVEIE